MVRRLPFLAALFALAACGGSDGANPEAGPADAGADAPPADAPPDTGPPPPPPPSRAAEAPVRQWVDPFIGSGGLGFGTGSCFPGPQLPFGMARPGPDTTEPDGAPPFTHFSGYYHRDSMIQGFSLTRVHGTGITDYGVPALMPVSGMTLAKTRQEGYRSTFDKATEHASPGSYDVHLDEGDIDVELTATDRVGLMRFTFPAGTDAAVVLDVGHHIGDVTIVAGEVTVDAGAREIEGFSHFRGGYSNRYGGMPVYFVARFDAAFASHGVFADGALAEGEATRAGTDAGAYVRFEATDGATVTAAVGLSFVDVAHARMNLDAEAADLDFDAARDAAEATWESWLSRVRVEGRSERDFRIFYTALYHTLLMPTLAMDVDGSYRGLDAEVHLADGYRYSTDLSLWDTFRSLHPWLALAYPEAQTDFLKSLVAMARDGGYMPRWPLGIGYTDGMVGESATVVFADSLVKGLDDFDLRAAYDAMRRTAMEPVPAGSPYGGRGGIAQYVELGYVPIEASGGSASRTLEYAYDDHALAVLAEGLGEADDVAMFRERAGYWRNLFDAETGFLVGRTADGAFPAELDPLVWEDFYVEGNAWQYMWYAPHDLDGLAEAHGGPAEAVVRLTDFFDRSSRRPVNTLVPGNHYWHGNEPDIHAAYAFSAWDAPAEAARWTRWIGRELYGDDPGGLPGNDDGGTLSAWYVTTALGFFPIAGTDEYLVGSPIFTHAEITLPSGGSLVIDAPDASDAALYVTDLRLDGTSLPRARFTHGQIADGAVLSFDMADAPGDWGTAP